MDRKNTSQNHNADIKKLSSFIVIFFLIWIVRQYIYITVDQSLEGYPKTLLSITTKAICWLGLLYLYTKYVYKSKISELIKFNINKKGILWAGIFGAILLTTNLIYNQISKGYLFDINLSFRGVLSAAIAAPLIEEFVFRGFILTKIAELIPFPYANLTTSILFVAIHFPGWLIWGGGISLIPTLSIFAVSIIWGYLYKQTQTIWSPILAHSLNNIVSMIV